MNAIKKYYKQIIFIIIILIIWIYEYKSEIDYNNLKVKLLQAQQTLKKEAEPKKFEIIKKEISIEQTKNEELKKILDDTKIKYDKNIWKLRCLDYLWQIELKQLKIKLDCDSSLEDRASYNLNSTLDKLGLNE